MPSMGSSNGCRLLADLAELFNCRLPTQVIVLTVGQPEKQDRTQEPLPPEYDFMAACNVGDRVPLIIKGLRQNPDDPTGPMIPGELGGGATFSVEPPETAVVEDDAGTPKARGLAQGAATITALQPLKSGEVLTLVGLLVVNDTADDATIAELEFGPVEPAAG